MTRGLVKRIGGKHYNHKYFTHLFPDANVYCELFVGGGSVVFNKKKNYDTVVINDLDTRLIEAYRYIQKNGSSASIDGTYTAEQFKEFVSSSDPLDFIRQQRLSWPTNSVIFDTTAKAVKESRHILKNTLKHFTVLQEKLENVIIHNNDWYDILVRYDSPDTFFYLDPPYENSKKTADKCYTDINLQHLFEALRVIKGKFLMTLNNSERTRELSQGFTTSTYTAYYARTNKEHTELIIQNF